jgi:hypothetical protein
MPHEVTPRIVPWGNPGRASTAAIGAAEEGVEESAEIDLFSEEKKTINGANQNNQQRESSSLQANKTNALTKKKFYQFVFLASLQILYQSS